MSEVVIASGSKSRKIACNASSRGDIAPSSSPSTTAPRLPNMISPGAIQSAPKLMNAPMVRSRPTMRWMISSLSPFCSDSTVAVLRQMWGQRAGGCLGVLRLHREEYTPPGAGQLIRHEGGCDDGKLLDRAGDPQAGAGDRRDMLAHPHRRT